MGNIRLGDLEKVQGRSAEWLVANDPQRAVSVFLLGCIGPADESFKRIFSRERLALFPAELIVELVDACCSAVNFCIGKLAKLQGTGDGIQKSLWDGRLKIALELLSRIVLRLGEGRVLPVLDLALRLYEDRTLGQSQSNVTRELSHLFRRIIECLPAQALQSYASKFASLPLIGLDGFDPVSKDGWPEPLVDLENRLEADSLPTRAARDTEWSLVVDRLLHGAGRQGLHPRSKAVKRLSVLHRWGLLGDGERLQFARALWEYQLDDHGFPQDVAVDDWEFLELPDIERGRAEALFRRKYFSEPGDDKTDLRNFFANILNATTGRRAAFHVSVEESRHLWQRIRTWLKVALQESEHHDFFSEFTGKLDVPRLVVRTVAAVILPNLPTQSRDLAREAWSVIKDLHKLEAPVEQALPGLLRLDPSRFMEVAEWLRQSSASLDPRPAKAAVSAIYYWLKEGPRLEIEAIPIDLVREIGLVVATRRPSNIVYALELATSMIKDRFSVVDEGFARLLTEGLSYLLEEARYNRFDQEESENPERAELLRFHCVRMALALQENGFGGISPAIAEWLQQAASDPMAGIRNLVSSKDSVPDE